MIQPKCWLLDRVLVLKNIYRESVEPCHFFWVILWVQFSIWDNTLEEEYHVKEISWTKFVRVPDTYVVKIKDILQCYQLNNIQNVKQTRWFVKFENLESQEIKKYIQKFIKRKEFEVANDTWYTDYSST